MTIHNSDPFATPEHARSPVRRLRGRLPAAVTLWTAVDPGGRVRSGAGEVGGGAGGNSGEPAGLTVSSTLVVDGEPGRLLGMLDDESDLWVAIQAAGRFAVAPLGPGDRQLADRFAGMLPAPGGLFREYEWTGTPYGPVPGGTWAGCRLDSARPFGRGLLVEATIERIELGEPTAPVVYYRGRYRELA